MTNRVLLNNVDHGDLRVLTGHGARFGDDINQVLVLPTEFEDVQREYPMFFRKDATGAYQTIALLGLDRDENLFLDDGSWRARYVPAVQQRGPFSIALQGDRSADAAQPELMIHVDLDHPRISRTEGEAVFLPAGGNAPYLQGVVGLLGAIYDGLEMGPAMFAAFEELALIEPVVVEIKLDDERSYDLPDLYTISQERLVGLDAADLLRLHRSGLLRAAQWVVSSMGNLRTLIDLKTRRLAEV
ncbi:peptide ABC transporter permease [Caulobacter sp. Root655]|uniref:SapC family protein n=1 Tax=Caulobacter sp. Root655 TaxID=1736578 RepID=UPI0006FC27EE|nr:SapC family protein [Caulobacter sp. Root655]KRA59257.1 peptide ABC transporter permease [Caulobacter sp. Root655]